MSLDDITPEEWDRLGKGILDPEAPRLYEYSERLSERTKEFLEAEERYRQREEDKAEGVLAVQVGGDHYKKLKIQPIEYIAANNLGFIEGNIVKYATRWKEKGGIQDIDKIIHYAELLKKYASVVK